jgi:prepilin-type N-terminal cleavage/methylation domain-containing protein/prepilin-type processing-associated H-X9-DG protein
LTLIELLRIAASHKQASVSRDSEISTQSETEFVAMNRRSTFGRRRSALPRSLRARQASAFTLVELLVVIAIIGILVALLLPAIQAAREAARRSECQNNLKQIGIAVANYELSHKSYPPGCFLGEGSAWSAFILPFLEEGNAFDWLVIQEPVIGVNYQWAYSGGQYEDATKLPDNFRNIRIIETVMKVYRCPSAGLPEHQTDLSADAWWVMRRSPASYLGVVSGLETRQHPSWRMRFQRAPTQNPNFPGVDGVMVGLHHRDEAKTRIALRMITDGTSKTAMVGEAAHDSDTQEAKGTIREAEPGNRKDHWWGGSDDIDLGRPGDVFVDLSEMLGSTGVPINFQEDPAKNQTMCVNPDSPECQKLQLSFGSEHSGIAQMVFCDGHVEGVAEDIDAKVWSDYGSRASQSLFIDGSAPPR